MNIKRHFIGVVVGAGIGIINCLFLLFASDIVITVYVATFTTWVVTGLLIGVVDLKINNAIKGAFVSLLVYLPSLVYAMSSTLFGAIYNTIVTIIFGTLAGYIIGKIKGSKNGKK